MLQKSISDLHLGGAVPHLLEKIELFIKEEQQDKQKKKYLCGFMNWRPTEQRKIFKRREFDRKIVM